MIPAIWKKTFFHLALLALLGMAHQVQAQDEQADAVPAKPVFERIDDPRRMKSLLFSDWQINLIQEARRGGITSLPQNMAEYMKQFGADFDENALIDKNAPSLSVKNINDLAKLGVDVEAGAEEQLSEAGLGDDSALPEVEGAPVAQDQELLDDIAKVRQGTDLVALPPLGAQPAPAVQRPAPGVRELRLSGILYNSDESWTIWLNGQKVQPGSVPREIQFIRVTDDYVDIRWLDRYTNTIYPIRLRPYQRFNLDSRLFLPG